MWRDDFGYNYFSFGAATTWSYKNSIHIMLVQVSGLWYLDCCNLHFSRDGEAPSGTVRGLGHSAWPCELGNLSSLWFTWFRNVLMLDVVRKGPSGLPHIHHFQLGAQMDWPQMLGWKSDWTSLSISCFALISSPHHVPNGETSRSIYRNKFRLYSAPECPLFRINRLVGIFMCWLDWQ